MAELTDKEIIKSLTDENEELSETICSWSRNCGQLSDQICKLKTLNKKMTAENKELTSKLDKAVVQLHDRHKDVKYVMELLDKAKIENKDLKVENEKLKMKLKGKQVPGECTTAVDDATADQNVASALKGRICAKDDLIIFLKEICDAKVAEIEELQKVNKLLKSKIQRNERNISSQ